MSLRGFAIAYLRLNKTSQMDLKTETQERNRMPESNIYCWDCNARMDPVLELQVKTSKMLALGFTFTIVWLYGVGSLFALILGLKGRRIVKLSNGDIHGLKMAWWCIIVGAAETLLAIMVVFSLITT